MVELGSRLNTLFQVSCALRVWPAKTRMPMTRICSWTLYDPEHAPGEELPKIPLLLGFKDSHYRRKCLAVSLYCPLISISKVINGRQKNEGHLATEKFVGEDWKRTKERLKTIKPIISKVLCMRSLFLCLKSTGTQPEEANYLFLSTVLQFSINLLLLPHEAVKCASKLYQNDRSQARFGTEVKS